jgi:hypothetical protein
MVGSEFSYAFLVISLGHKRTNAVAGNVKQTDGAEEVIFFPDAYQKKSSSFQDE